MSGFRAAFLAAAAGVILASAPCSAAVPANPLAGTSWMMELPKNSSCELPPTVEFLSAGVSADLGCNLLRAGTEISGQRLRFTDVRTGSKRCAAPLMELEARMLDMIRRTASWRRTDSGLTFLDETGTEILTLVPEKPGACQ